MALFMSTYVNKVDRKGRVSVPATFRAVLNDQSFEGIVAFPSLDYDALEATGIDTMEAISAGLDEIEQSEEQQGFATLILARSQRLPFDPEGRITSWNKAAEQLFGYTAAEAVGTPLAILIPLDQQDEETALLERIKRGERAHPPL